MEARLAEDGSIKGGGGRGFPHWGHQTFILWVGGKEWERNLWFFFCRYVVMCKLVFRRFFSVSLVSGTRQINCSDRRRRKQNGQENRKREDCSKFALKGRAGKGGGGRDFQDRKLWEKNARRESSTGSIVCHSIPHCTIKLKTKNVGIKVLIISPRFYFVKLRFLCKFLISHFSLHKPSTVRLRGGGAWRIG